MRTTGRVSSRLLVLVGGVTFGALACAGGGDDPIRVEVCPSAAKPIAAISLTPSSATLESVGATAQLAASAKAGDGSSCSGVTFGYSSSAPDVATVSASGLVTAVGNGTASIIASAGGQSGSVSIEVAQKVASVKVEAPVGVLDAVGATIQLSAIGRDAKDNVVAGASFTWSSSAENVLTVNASGLATAVGSGAAKVTAIADGKSGSADISVAQRVASISVAPGADTLEALGATVQLIAVVKDANGNVINGPAVTWLSSAASVVSVDANGLARAVANGPATVSAIAGAVSGGVSLLVSQRVASVAISPAEAQLAPGGQQQFAAEAQDANGNAVNVKFLWVSSNHNVAIVDNNGLATAVSGGNASITVAGHGVPASAALSVSAAPPPPQPPPPPPATQLAFSVQPSNATEGRAISPAVEVEVRDAHGALVTSSRAAVTLAIGSNPGAGGLSGTRTVNAINGVASFAGLSINKAGAGYTLAASSGTLSGATSDPFDIFTPKLLTVVRAGSGNGAVTSSSPGISCGADCTETYDHGTTVTLTAGAAAGSAFAGWSGGGCSGTGATCTVTLTAATTVTATFAAIQHTLTVSKGSSSGSGTVTSSPAGISCGSDCSEPYNQGAQVTLTASAAAGSTFAGWSGAGCSGTGSCTVTLNAAATVTATFTINQYILTVSKGSSSGTGTVTSSPAGIACGADCTESYTHGTTVTLTASAAAGSSFTGWSGGGCSGTGTCAVTMTSAATVTATFAVQHTLTVSKSGNGGPSGTVTSNPAGISCGNDCSEPYNVGTQVTLTASAGTGSTFTGWSGACSGTGSCTVTMNAAASVTATFTLVKHTLTVRVTSGNGDVSSTPDGISCGNDCSEPYDHDTTITLTANAARGWVVGQWIGCTPDGFLQRTCTVKMTEAKSVSVRFESTIQ